MCSRKPSASQERRRIAGRPLNHLRSEPTSRLHDRAFVTSRSGYGREVRQRSARHETSGDTHATRRTHQCRDHIAIADHRHGNAGRRRPRAVDDVIPAAHSPQNRDGKRALVERRRPIEDRLDRNERPNADLHQRPIGSTRKTALAATQPVEVGCPKTSQSDGEQQSEATANAELSPLPMIVYENNPRSDKCHPSRPAMQARILASDRFEIECRLRTARPTP